MATKESNKIVIIGSGFVGQSWAMLFASGGYQVCLYDIEKFKLDQALTNIKSQFDVLEKNGTLLGKISAEEQFKLISTSESLDDAMKDSIYCQECVFENLQLKISVFKQLDKYASNGMVLASSTSCLLPSTFSESLCHRTQVIVAHPVNPVYYIPLVEIIPALWTHDSVVERTKNLMREIGRRPVLLKREIPGFLVNRLQYSLLNECWRLIDTDVVDVEDLDAVMSEGLGLRYAFIGPFETAHLNANGMKDYLNRYANGIYEVSKTFGPIPRMEGPTANEICDQLQKRLPFDKLEKRRQWREKCLIAITQLKKSLEQD